MATTKFRRNTRQRQVILDQLRSLTTHPTASELYELVRKRLPKISLGTVYRNLELLSRTGMVSKLENAGSETRFDGDLDDHHHIRCRGCGRLEDIHGLAFDPPPPDRNQARGFEIIGHRLEYIGFCPECTPEQSGG